MFFLSPEQPALQIFRGDVLLYSKEFKDKLNEQYQYFKSLNLNLDMSRGKPCPEQLALSNSMLDLVNSQSNFKINEEIDCRNYGLLDGITELKVLFAKMLDVLPTDVLIGGNSSLQMMFDTISCFMTHKIVDGHPWLMQGNIKFLCPVPGYDRHFSILQYFGVEQIAVPMCETGPDMDMVENLVSKDEKIKGIWCIPKYSNPQGVTYSAITVQRFANLKPAAKDFRIFWDNAYAVHDLTDQPERLLSIMDECRKASNEDLPILFCSTSKITFPGAGIAALAASESNLKILKENYFYKTICFDKINQLRHLRFLKNYEGILSHMEKHKKILKPKFEAVEEILNTEFEGEELISWTKPKGGYFISVALPDGCAKRVVFLCREAGVKLTSAGATFPLNCDPHDANIRLAPSYPPVCELLLAMKLFCVCVKLVFVENALR
ncbi:MAG: aminotransferase [Oscillospiraceae bacterium]|jgi:aspartate/methionine/tyrosine aminotransferase|nr:aminotransferase [Oscillospiraceae bacterium]